MAAPSPTARSLTPSTFGYELAPSGVATITFARPDRLNSLTFESYAELRDVFVAMEEHPEVRAVVVTGTGRGFCSGGDVEAIIGELFARDVQGLLAFTRLTGQLIGAMRRLRRPIVAALNGVAVGAGAVIALASDFRLAATSARIGFVFPRVGLSGADMGVTYLLPRVVGLARATELLFTGDVLNAEDAYRVGLLNAVHPDASLGAEARRFAERLASGPAFASSITKQMLESEQTMTLEQALEAEAQAQALCMMHPDFRTSYDAWARKEPIRFAGAAAPFGASSGSSAVTPSASPPGPLPATPSTTRG